MGVRCWLFTFTSWFLGSAPGSSGEEVSACFKTVNGVTEGTTKGRMKLMRLSIRYMWHGPFLLRYYCYTSFDSFTMCPKHHVVALKDQKIYILD